MSTPLLHKELEVATTLAKQAGAIIRKYCRNAVEVDYKDAAGSDPVTQADRDANELIVGGLQKAFPNDSILAEESSDSLERQDNNRLWCVDPLDGTREFIEQNGQFVVMIGLAIDGRSRLGVVYQPTEDILWWGAEGRAGLSVAGEDPRPLRVNSVKQSEGATMVVSRSHRSGDLEEIAARLSIETLLPLGSVGLKVAQISSGSADVYVSTTDKTKEWDSCAPEAIITAAGGRMTDLLGAPLRYNKTIPNTPRGMLATSGPLHEAAVLASSPIVEKKGWSLA